jgi:hypothetical protein
MYIVQTFTPGSARGKRFSVKRGHITTGKGKNERIVEFATMKEALIAADRVEGGTAIVRADNRSGHGRW